MIRFRDIAPEKPKIAPSKAVRKEIAKKALKSAKPGKPKRKFKGPA